MAVLQFAGGSVQTDTEGFLVNANEWNRDIAAQLAQGSNIELTPRHWDVIDFCRKDFAETGQAPGLRRITKVGKIPTKDLYKLFPGGPGKLSAKIAGLPKPTGCV